MMRLVCEKYRETMAAGDARCRHGNEYCKFRSGCMIHFLAQEERRSGEGGREPDDAPSGGEEEAVER